MKYPTLSIITALTRLENLPAMRQSIECEFTRMRTQWLANPGIAGDYGKGKNLGLIQASCDWLYVLDDDNLIHPDFESALVCAVAEHPNAAAFVFSQDCGSFTRHASRENFRGGAIDQGQYVWRRDATGECRFCERYESDWLFFEAVLLPLNERCVPIDRVATYYNRLRP